MRFIPSEVFLFIIIFLYIYTHTPKQSVTDQLFRFFPLWSKQPRTLPPLSTHIQPLPRPRRIQVISRLSFIPGKRLSIFSGYSTVFPLASYLPLLRLFFEVISSCRSVPQPSTTRVRQFSNPLSFLLSRWGCLPGLRNASKSPVISASRC